MSKSSSRRKSSRNSLPFSRQEILALLEQPERPSLTAKALLVRLGGDPRKGSLLRALLAEMVDAGEIERAGRRYRAKRKRGSEGQHAIRSKTFIASLKESFAEIPTATLLLIILALVVSVGAAYFGTLDADFLDWNDPQYVSENQHIRTLSWDTIRWAFTSYDLGTWHPLTWISLTLDYQRYSLEPSGYHLTSMVLHISNTILVFVVLFLLTGAVWRSAVVAALFGLHPTHVESVAWIAARQGVLGTFFWLLAVAVYIGFTRTRMRSFYLLTLLTFGLALLSSPIVVTLPVVLLLLDFWPLRNLSRQALLDKLPLFGMAALSALLVYWSRTSGTEGIESISFVDRVSNAFFSYVKYLWLTLWPINLSPWYSHPALEGLPLSWLVISGSIVLVIGVTCCTLFLSGRKPYISVGWLWFVITLFPVIGIMQIGSQGMADRYSYIPQLGLLIIVVWLAGELPIWKQRGRALGAAVVVLILVALGLATHQQAKVWSDDLTLWTYTVEANPDSFIAHRGLAQLLLSDERLEESLEHFQAAALIQPNSPEIHFQIGDLLSRKRDLEKAEEHWLRAVELDPNSAEYRTRLGTALARRGDLQAALFHLQIASELDHDLLQAHLMLGRVYRDLSEFDQAEAEFRAVLELSPGLAAAERDLDQVLRQQEQAMSLLP